MGEFLSSDMIILLWAVHGMFKFNPICISTFGEDSRSISEVGSCVGTSGCVTEGTRTMSGHQNLVVMEEEAALFGHLSLERLRQDRRSNFKEILLSLDLG